MTKKNLVISATAKSLLMIATVFVLVGAGCGDQTRLVPPTEPPSGKRAAATRAEDSIFVIEGEPVTLNDGRAEVRLSADAAVTTVTEIFGTPVAADLDGDGDLDAAIFLARDGGGSGRFYYAAASINESGEYRGTNAILLGDRVAPQTLEVRDGVIIANYADRKTGEPMTNQPSVGVSKYLRLESGELKETAKP